MTLAEEARATGDEQNRFPLSANLELFTFFDNGDDEGAFGPRHVVVLGWRVAGPIDLDALQGALDDVVERNEILRTEVVRADDDKHQRVLPASPVDLEVVDLPADDERSRDVRADDFINQVEAYELPVGKLPHVRAILGRFDDTDGVLVLVTHHTASDGWTMQVLMSETAAFYAERTGHGAANLPEPVQYKEFSEWQQEALTSDEANQARAYWRDKLDGAVMSMFVMDQPEGVPYGYAVRRFVWPAELADATKQLAKALRASPFMVLTAAYNALLHKVTGETDLVGLTLTSGRNEPRFADTVGPFFNMIPLRTDLTDCRTFSQLLDRTRATCLEALAAELPFAQIEAEAPELAKPYAAGNLAACAFQVFQFPNAMDSTTVGDLTYTEVRKREQSYPDTSEIPNGTVFALDLLPSGEIAGHFRYNKRDFLESTVDDLTGTYREILARVTAEPTVKLSDL